MTNGALKKITMNFIWRVRTCLVALPGYPMIDAPTYQVIVEPLRWNGGCVGKLYAYDLGNNGFKVTSTGDADNIEFRWTIINPDV